MAKYLDPKNDLVFKRVFGEHPHLLISFLNALLPLEGGQIVSWEQLHIKNHPTLEKSIISVCCLTNTGLDFCVFMQRANEMDCFSLLRYVKNNIGYSSTAQLWVFFINNEIDKEYKTEQFYHTQTFDEGFEFVQIELPKFNPDTWADRPMAVLWLRFLKEVNEWTPHIADELMENKDIRQAIDLCECDSFSHEEKKIIQSEKTFSKLSFAKGEQKKTVQVILNSNKKGMSIADIADITDLSPEQVTTILKKQEFLNS
ncbi:hypothetical protein FACS189430_07900 [Bacteroidia bacterium]|nr:hypothetical protein FACS189430_07900 [Bacteroidia bacterium]